MILYETKQIKMATQFSLSVISFSYKTFSHVFYRTKYYIVIIYKLILLQHLEGVTIGNKDSDFALASFGVTKLLMYDDCLH